MKGDKTRFLNTNNTYIALLRLHILSSPPLQRTNKRLRSLPSWVDEERHWKDKIVVCFFRWLVGWLVVFRRRSPSFVFEGSALRLVSLQNGATFPRHFEVSASPLPLMLLDSACSSLSPGQSVASVSCRISLGLD